MRYLLILLLLTSSFIYSSEKEDEAKECASITDINKRLSCYDSIFTKQKIENPKLIASK